MPTLRDRQAVEIAQKAPIWEQNEMLANVGADQVVLGVTGLHIFIFIP
jgi:hypothetical protein